MKGKISEAFWTERSNQWRDEIATLKSALRPLNRQDERVKRLTMERTIELIKDIKNLWLSAPTEKRRELVGLTLSNLTLKQEKLDVSYQTPFNFLAEAKQTANWWT